jgi:hypothetical protein
MTEISIFQFNIEIDWFYKNDGWDFNQTYFFSSFGLLFFIMYFIEGWKKEVYQIININNH